MAGLLSLSKFLFLAFVVVVIYIWSRRNALQSRGNHGRGQDGGQTRTQGGKAQSGSGASNAKQKAIEDLVKCPSCGTYISAGSTCSCGQGRR